jgi:HK97 family phage prohead protease
MKIIIRSDHVHIEGYVNAVERLSKPITERLGTFRERVMAGTFKKALKRAPDVRILLNHKAERDLGGIKDGNLKLEEDAIGLRAEADIYDAEVIKDAKAGNLVGWSFGFYPLDSRDTSEDGMPIKELHDIDLQEVSLLNKYHIPAYDGTLVAVRDNDEKMVIGESMMADDIEIREDETAPATESQETKPETTNEVSSEYFAGYRNMIAEMKA